MEYKYLLENIANNNITAEELDTNILYILCYHINTQAKYPFLQFMVEKIPYIENMLDEEFVLPHISIINKDDSIMDLSLAKIKNALNIMGLTNVKLTNDMYKGIVMHGTNVYILINITEIKLVYCNSSSYWFILTSEIINEQKLCDIPVSKEVSQLFIVRPQVGLLTNIITNTYYNLPEAVYTFDESKKAEFKSIFGNTKSRVYKNCGEYFYFYRSFKKRNSDLKTNRYALFVEGNLYLEMGDEFLLSDLTINELYPEPCIIICYLKSNLNPDMLVKHYEYFVPLTYF